QRPAPARARLLPEHHAPLDGDAAAPEAGVAREPDPRAPDDALATPRAGQRVRVQGTPRLRRREVRGVGRGRPDRHGLRGKRRLAHLIEAPAREPRGLPAAGFLRTWRIFFGGWLTASRLSPIFHLQVN